MGMCQRHWWSWGSEALIFYESFLSVEGASLPSTEILLLLKKWDSAALPEWILIASFEEVAMQDNANSVQDLPLPHFFASGPITSLKYQ